VTLNSIGDAVISSDISGTITFLNLMAEMMTGWSRDEAVGRRMADVFRSVDAMSREATRNPMTAAREHDRTAHLPANCILIGLDGEIPIEGKAS
jgi:PAS domain S-box-containing protein